jgi:hypothetical protein
MTRAQHVIDILGEAKSKEDWLDSLKNIEDKILDGKAKNLRAALKKFGIDPDGKDNWKAVSKLDAKKLQALHGMLFKGAKSILD